MNAETRRNHNNSFCRSRLRKRTKGGENQGSDKGSEDGSVSKDGQDKTGSDDEDAIREPQKFDLTLDTTQIGREKFKSVRDFFGEDEAVYIMDAKTTGNIGRYLNVIFFNLQQMFYFNLLSDLKNQARADVHIEIINTNRFFFSALL